ncbi:MAG: secretin and TonB N-terminal domain-containing protein [Candidatus Omnitrophica bacterium]|jgi:type IV pilus assembly protein PilQ|nr:secretin and TonB N-terminal domain-containing protein [Candidatus Omnitrophota bacterium]
MQGKNSVSYQLSAFSFQLKTKKTIAIITLILFFMGMCPSLLLSQDQQETKTASNLISLNLRDVNIEDALKVIAQASGMNVILDKDVKATVNINLKNVTWNTALDNILKTNQLTYKIQENIIRVMTLDSLKKEDDTLPLSLKIISLNFARADEIQKSLTKMLSPRGNIEINASTNSLIISDSQETFPKLEEVISKLDTRIPQVMVETLIVSFKGSNTYRQGVDMTLMSNKHGTDRQYWQYPVGDQNGMAGVMDFSYAKPILSGLDLASTLRLFSEDARVNILANPKVMTLDNKEASIEILEQVPYQSQSTTEQGTVVSTSFKDAGLKILVTPHITKDQFISLAVKGEHSYIAAYVNNQPQIDARKIETNFMLKDGEVAVIGGLRKKDKTYTVTKVPVLGDIPFIGKILFSKIVKTDVDNELIIFISPHIMETNLASSSEQINYKGAHEELVGLTNKKKEALRNQAIENYFQTQQPPSPRKKQ